MEADETESKHSDDLPRTGADRAREIFGDLMDLAFTGEPQLITRFDRGRIVWLSVREYDRLKEIEAGVLARAEAKPKRRRAANR
jgi:hypothetical protein